MSPDTISALEVVRLVVALFGLTVSWRGRIKAREVRAGISTEPTTDLRERHSREIVNRRMSVFESAQTGFCVIHATLAGNALANMGYPNPSIEQLNVLTSNVTQIMIPLILARVSELLTIQLVHALGLREISKDLE